MPETHLTPPLAGRTALVTGAASGIGAAVAERLAGDGAHVLVVDRDTEGATTVASRVGGTALVVDLTDPEDLASLPLDTVDVLVNNAGFQHVAPVHELDPTVWRRMHALMLEAPFLLSRGVLPGMYERGWGRLVHVTSIHGHRASPFKAPYVAAKHGLEGLSKVIAIEGAPHGVTSTTVAPGYVRTPLVEQQIADQAQQHDLPADRVVDEVLLARSPLKRMVEPSEVASVVGWLCGPDAVSVTGTSHLLDGGWSAT
ncbi:3-hydroxybutyrate dehydrogenase [Nocardioides zeae]|uniref:SDR family oxidoreductase n=1 Tax=Nocardioides zeae TaxID=1457234 RepID=A0A6P0HJV1_9ACTN|nr:3-hydroxybutyrate dehydrogenase [Nocardioides zeae]NEN78958.1 SDR family oxidoreductase [Nocardioides zeae]